MFHYDNCRRYWKKLRKDDKFLIVYVGTIIRFSDKAIFVFVLVQLFINHMTVVNFFHFSEKPAFDLTCISKTYKVLITKISRCIFRSDPFAIDSYSIANHTRYNDNNPPRGTRNVFENHSILSMITHRSRGRVQGVDNTSPPKMTCGFLI